MNPEIEGDVELYVVTDIFWQKGKGNRQKPPRTKPSRQKPPQTIERDLYTGGFVRLCLYY